MPIIKDKLKHSDFNILNYIQTQTDDFTRTAFNEVDSVIFAQFTYLYFDKFISSFEQDKMWVPISQMYKAEEFEHMTADTLYPSDNKNLLIALCASPRFRDVQMNYYDNKFDVAAQEQFCAMSFKLPSGEVVVGFRGTDSTVIGWKEDFNMLFLSPVPSQISAVNYLEKVADKTKANIYIVGHSKGGNLAVYSALFAKKQVRDKIIRVYDLDGPGFQSQVWDEHEVDSDEIEQKITKVMPEGSFIGIVLSSPIKEKAIKSSAFGMLQHETFTWQISDNEFIASESVTSHVKYIEKTLDDMLVELDIEQRKLVVDTVFKVIDKTSAERLNDIVPIIIKEKDTILEAINEIDEQTAKFVKEVFIGLIKSYFAPSFKRDSDKKAEEKKRDEKKAIAIFERGIRGILDSRADNKAKSNGVEDEIEDWFFK